MSQFVVSRFGSQGRKLFGLLQRPIGAKSTGHAVLLCNPFGQEAIRCHRMYRVLSERLVRNGIHCLRFDYLGTGDSDGEDVDQSLAQWHADTVSASQFLVEQSNASRVSWFGLRLGGTIAAMASMNCPQTIDKLVIWDAVFDGASYLAELIAVHDQENAQAYGSRWKLDSALRNRLLAQTKEQVLGFPISQELRRQISGIWQDGLTEINARTVTAFFGEGTKTQHFSEEIRAQCNSFVMRTLSTNVQWASNEAMNSALVPGEALQAISLELSGE